MIWFACKQCGKKHSRPESSAGTLVFCECGQGNLVPWESSVAEPEGPPPLPAAVPLPEPPRLQPIPVSEERRASLPPRRPDTAPLRRRGQARERDPNYCFNHMDLAAEETCAACKERFCRHCLIQFEGQLLCAPCKNERIRVLTRPPRLSGMAVTAVILALLSGPLALCLVPLTASAGALLALLPQLFAFALAGMALHATEADSRLSGRALAIAAMVTAGVGVILTVGMTLYSFVQWV